jgi:hypothetical protein
MVDRKERRWIWWFSIGVCVVFSLPYLFGFALQGSSRVFTGFLFGVEDGNSYIAKMLQGANGAWLFKTPYTTFPQNGAVVYLPYILLGKLAAPPGMHEQLVVLYHIFRLVSTFLLAFATYDFLALLIRSVSLRRLGTLLLVCGGGLGWLSLVGLNGIWGGRMSLEYYSPEAFGYLMVLGLPHLACARAFMLWGLREALQSENILSNWRTGLKSGLLWSGVGLMQPMIVIVAWAAIGAYILLKAILNGWSRWQGKPADWIDFARNVWQAVSVGLVSAPLVLYTFLAFRLDPYLVNWEKQNVLTSPPFSDYLLAYALILPMAVLGIHAAFKSRLKEGLFLSAWLVIIPFLVYLPLTIQRRLVEGAWICLVGLALYWLALCRPQTQKWLSRLLIATLITPLLFFLGGVFALAQGYSPIFRPAGEVKAFQFLEGQEKPGSVVLASEEVSNPLPAWAPVQTLAGHGPESVHSPEILEEEKAFFDLRTDDATRKAFLSRFHVNYVFWGPEERLYGSWEPTQANYLETVYKDGSYSVFKVAISLEGAP